MSSKESLARAELAIDSARTLFRKGILAECHAYFAVALRCLLDVWVPSESPESEEGVAPNERRERGLLAVSGAKYAHFERLSTTYRAVEDRAPRATPAAAAPSERDLDALSAEVDRLHRFTSRHFASAETRRRFRLRLGLALALVVLAPGVALLLGPKPARVVASANYGPTFLPEFAADRSISTEWLLPDNTEGWVDVRFESPRIVHSVTLSNCHNTSYLDRGSEKVRVTAFSGDEVVATAEGAFTQITAERADLNLRLPAKNVTRVRAEVLSHFGRGGGFAEVEVN